MSLDPETEICMSIQRILSAGVPDVEQRVLRSAVIQTDARFWPCLQVIPGATPVETAGGVPGRRVQTRHLQVTVLVVDNGAPDAFDEDGLRAIGLKVEESLMADPYLKEGQPRARATNLILTSTATDVTAQRGAAIGVRRLDFIVSYHTRETNPSETMSRQH